jgi:RNA polymerase sigma factor (sigma-70 family)
VTISTTIHLERCLRRIGQHDESARAELLSFAGRRLKILADRMFTRIPQLYSLEQSDDLLQEAMIRLWQSLEEVYPTTVAAFMGLAATQMRRALIDLARRHFGRHQQGQLHQAIARAPLHERCTVLMKQKGDETNAVEELLSWSDFHAAADRLPEPQRTAFDLLFYHELPQAEVAEMMNVSIRQVQRYWNSARLKLFEMMEGAWPEL